MASTKIETSIYRLFQENGLLTHEGSSGENLLPKGIQDGTAVLTPNQRQKLNDVLSHFIGLCNANLDEAKQTYGAVWNKHDEWIEYARSQNLAGAQTLFENSANRSSKNQNTGMPDAPSDLPPDQAAVSSSAPSQSHAPPNQADVSPSNNIQYHPPLDQVAVSSAKRNQSLSPPDQVGVSSSIPESTGDLGLKYDRGNTSIENEWYEYHDALKIKGDSKNTVILFEKGIKGKNGHVTHYGVQRRISEKYCFEMVKEFEVQVALEDWRKLTRRMTIQAQEREVMNKDRYGVLRKFWGCAYMTPKEREIGPSRSPYTECIIQTSGRAGFLVLTLSNFRSVEGQNRADLYVEETCLRDDIPLPWNVHPQFIRILDPECHRKPQTRRQAIATKMPLLSEPHTTDQDLDAKITRIVDAKISPLQSKMNGIDQRLDLLTEMLSRIALKMDIRK